MVFVNDYKLNATTRLLQGSANPEEQVAYLWEGYLANATQGTMPWAVWLCPGNVD
jgi:hypothetical protein